MRPVTLSRYPSKRALAVAVGAFVLTGCAAPRFQSEAPGPNTAEVSVSFEISSSRSVIFGGVYEDGRTCRNYRMTNVDGRTATSYEMRVKAETLSMVFLSAGEFSGTFIGPGVFSGRKCGGTYSFEPKSGSHYQVRFHDAPDSCRLSVIEDTGGIRRDISQHVVRRDAELPRSSPCKDSYVPG